VALYFINLYAADSTNGGLAPHWTSFRYVSSVRSTLNLKLNIRRLVQRTEPTTVW